MIALCICVKGTENEADLLKRCLKSVSKHVDGVFIQLNAPKGKKIHPKVRAVAEAYTNKIRTYVWTGNFAAARNDNFAQVSKEYEHIIWLDADDTVENPEKIREVASIMPKDVHGLYVLYDYAHDQYGNVTVSHWNCRLIRNNGTYSWKSSIDDSEVSVHETLVPNRSVKQASNDEFKVIHHADNDRQNSSLIRNIELLEGMYERHKKSRLDPRILFYLATHYYDAGRLEDVRERLYEYLQVSGWAEERSEAHVFMGKIFLHYQKTPAAKTAFLQALGENNRNIGAYLELAKLEYSESRYDQAITWIRAGLKIKQGPQAMVLFSGYYEIYFLLSECLVNLGGKDLSEALKWADKAVELRPFDPEAIDHRDKIFNVVEYREDMKAAGRLIRRLNKDKEPVMPFVESLPKELSDSPVAIAARLDSSTPKKWPKKSMAIYCGGSPLGIWGPWSLEQGIGGSEEAVVRLSKELTKLGWKVVVYATPGERAGEYGGIDWKQYWEFNPNDKFDVVVAWRMPSFFDTSISSRKAYLWLHDVMEKSEFTPERLKNLTKVIVQSNYHRSLFPIVKDKQMFVSSNGISPEDFEIYDNPQKFMPYKNPKTEAQYEANKESLRGMPRMPRRNPHRIIYMSSHIRGLALLYDIWPDVKKAVPDAILDIYYGWQSYIDMNHANPGNQPGGMAWMRMMQAWERKLDGVTDHGKIGQNQIVQEIFKAGIWAYPCPFPEIYSITAVKAQAGGAVPVASNFAALEETVQYGIKLPMAAQDEDTPVGKWNKEDVSEYKIALIDMLKLKDEQNAIRPEMMKWARTQSWERVAKQWNAEMQ